MDRARPIKKTCYRGEAGAEVQNIELLGLEGDADVANPTPQIDWREGFSPPVVGNDEATGRGDALFLGDELHVGMQRLLHLRAYCGGATRPPSAAPSYATIRRAA